MLPVEIIYIGDDQAIFHVCLKVPSGTEVKQAINLSGLLSCFPESNTLPYAIFGRVVSGDTMLKAGDRIEILRPLKIDPMTKRRMRAQKD